MLLVLEDDSMGSVGPTLKGKMSTSDTGLLEHLRLLRGDKKKKRVALRRVVADILGTATQVVNPV
jgi:hypothetical protein